VHLHAFYTRCVIAAGSRGQKARHPGGFYLSHANVSCQRGTLLLWGEDFCDGKLDVIRCAGCTLQWPWNRTVRGRAD